MATKKITSSESMVDFWINEVAPNFLDLEDTNNYSQGLFGYINKVMADSVIDVSNAVGIARREFYPISAQHISSLYKMAATQKISPPTIIPGSIKNGTLIVDQQSVLTNSTVSNGLYTCVIDNTMVIKAGEKPFLLDYPIIILSKLNNGVWKHTISYDMSVPNELSNISSNYIKNKLIASNGSTKIMMNVVMRQLSMTEIPELITQDSTIQTTKLTIRFEGELASFDVFYVEDPESSTEVAMKKVFERGSKYSTPYYWYRMLDDNTIQIIFPKSSNYFTPATNSEIRVRVYTSLGTSGEFPIFKEMLSCDTSLSSKYPYNSNLIVEAIANSACSGAKNKKSKEDFRTTELLPAYATNNTITTATDLQQYYDKEFSDSSNRLVFKKKRDDAFVRLYSATGIFKDTEGNIIPTNTLDLILTLDDFEEYNDTTKKAIIKPGMLFTYGDGVYTGKKEKVIKLTDNLDIYDDTNKFIFTNPFLIIATLDPNIIGFYYNSLSTSISTECSYVNENNINQFICGNVTASRNAITGENFYKFSVNVTPASTIDGSLFMTQPATTDADYYFRAKKNGEIISKKMIDHHCVCTIKYTDGTEDTFNIGNWVTVEDDGSYKYHTGYKTTFNVFDTFIANDILATKLVTDLGKLRAGFDLNNVIMNASDFCPLVIEEYNKEMNGFVMSCYISTDDVINSDSTIQIIDGIKTATGQSSGDIGISMNELTAYIHIFYKDDSTNYSHQYDSIKYFTGYTLTNTYVQDAEEKINLIQQIDFIRSNLLFYELTTEQLEESPENFGIKITEVPLAKAGWVKIGNNYTNFTNTVIEHYDNLAETYYLLENNYNFDLKFYNTYGKSRKYQIGVEHSMIPLENVNLSIKFGIKLNPLADKDSFLSKFRTHIKDKIESINSVSSSGSSIYILNIIKELDNDESSFTEIEYLEYYGINNYGYSAQKIEPIPSSSSIIEGDDVGTIPEFINIYTYLQNDKMVPKVEVTFLDDGSV